MRRSSSPAFWIGSAAALLCLGAAALEIDAHKPVTSRYNYNVDIFPILRDSCGRCHVEGGPAPMGLMRWNDGPDSATPWAESIRQSVVGEHMPPWYVDPKGPAVKGGFGLSAAQTDKLLTWATGGTPEGDMSRMPEKVRYTPQWRGGSPDLTIEMASDYVMPAGEADTFTEFLLPTGLTGERWLRAVDVLPGSPEIVRNATISTENGAVLAVWVPGDNVVAAPDGAAFRLPAGSKLRLQLHYKKQWQNEGKVLRDRSTIGLYFAKASPAVREIRSWVGGVLSAKARVVAVRPSLDQVYRAVTVQATTPGGAKLPLLKLRGPRPDWRRRYWLVTPVDLPAGSRIEVITTPTASYVDLTGMRLVKTNPLEIAIDIVQ